MAMNVTQVQGTPATVGANQKIFDVEATADGDSDAVLLHNLGNSDVPLDVKLVPLDALTVPAGAVAFYMSQWVLRQGSSTPTTVTIRKVTTAGGAPGAQVRVIVSRPHSIPR